jgi:hypothetical protein
MRVFRSLSVRSVAVPLVSAIVVALALRELVPYHRSGAGILGAVAVIAGTLVVVATAFWARSLDARRARSTRRPTLVLSYSARLDAPWSGLATTLFHRTRLEPAKGRVRRIDDETLRVLLEFSGEGSLDEVTDPELSDQQVTRVHEIQRSAERDPGAYLRACRARGV